MERIPCEKQSHTGMTQTLGNISGRCRGRFLRTFRVEYKSKLNSKMVKTQYFQCECEQRSSTNEHHDVVAIQIWTVCEGSPWAGHDFDSWESSRTLFWRVTRQPTRWGSEPHRLRSPWRPAPSSKATRVVWDRRFRVDPPSWGRGVRVVLYFVVLWLLVLLALSVLSGCCWVGGLLTFVGNGGNRRLSPWK